MAKQKLQRPRCIVCENPSIDGMTHHKCKRSLTIDGSVSVWCYEGIVRTSLISLKYKFAHEIAKELAYWCSKYLKENITALPARATIIAVPLHISREKWRGFNQSHEIAKLIARYRNWDFLNDLVIRKNKNVPQANITKKELRKSNLKNAFVLNDKYSKLQRSVPVIIFDDVTTTGTTLKEVGKILKRSGFTSVWGLTVAR